MEISHKITNPPFNTTYTLGPGLIGQVISVRRSGSDYWHHYDALGDVMRLTNSSEQVVNEYAYDAWGNILSQTEAVANQYHFTTKEVHDNNLDLYCINPWE